MLIPIAGLASRAPLNRSDSGIYWGKENPYVLTQFD